MIKTLTALFAVYIQLSKCQNPAPFIPAITSQPQHIVTTPPQTPATSQSQPNPPISTQQQQVVPPQPPVVVSTTTTGAYGQTCANPAVDTQCRNTQQTAASMNGNTKCENDYDCCLCKYVQCGNFIQGCEMFSSGAFGVLGVQQINIQGKASGAHIKCIGVSACMDSAMRATNIKDVEASALNAMKNAVVTITDPLPDFSLNCIGSNGCDGAKFEVIIPGPPAGYACNPNAKEIIVFNRLSCVDFESCKDMDITIRNNGCNTILIQMLECLETDSCLGTNFNLIGDVQFNNCNLRGAATSTTTGIDNCFHNLERLICPDPTSCRDAVRTLVNPLNGFSLNCQHTGSCQNAVLEIDIDNNYDPNSFYNGPVSYFDTLKFSADSAGAGATIIINNRQGTILNVQRIECSETNSCAGTTFVIGHDVSVGEILCNAGACIGCQIKIDPLSPGIPCDPNAVAAFRPPLSQTQVPQQPNTPQPQPQGQPQPQPQPQPQGQVTGSPVGGKFIPI